MFFIVPALRLRQEWKEEWEMRGKKRKCRSPEDEIQKVYDRERGRENARARLRKEKVRKERKQKSDGMHRRTKEFKREGDGDRK